MDKKIPREGESPSHLTFFIGKQRRKILVPIKKEGIIIGRNSKKAKVDLDTNPLDGLEMGVSREHIHIIPKRDYFIVKDLESANSTWHNKVRMKPHVAEELYHGDLLHLGELRIEVYFAYEDEVQALHQTQVFADSLPQTRQFDMSGDTAHSQPNTKQLGTSSAQSGDTRQFDDD